MVLLAYLSLACLRVRWMLEGYQTANGYCSAATARAEDKREGRENTRKSPSRDNYPIAADPVVTSEYIKIHNPFMQQPHQQQLSPALNPFCV